MAPTSKTCWKNFEYFIRDLIGGTLQYAQSAKFYVRKEKLALGDVRSKHILAECKLRDNATKKFRKEHPAKPYKSFNIEFTWWDQLIQECADVNKDEKVNRIPVLFCRPKFGREEHTLVVINGKDWLKWMEQVDQEFTTHLTLLTKQNSKSITIKYDTILPKMIIRNEEAIFIMNLHTFSLAKSLWYQSEGK